MSIRTVTAQWHVVSALALLVLSGCSEPVAIDRIAESTDRVPVVSPSIDRCTIPPSMAPLNFRIAEDGSAFLVVAQDGKGGEVLVRSKDGRIRFDTDAWRRLLFACRGSTLSIHVACQDRSGSWRRYSPMELHVAREDSDPYLVYRLILPFYNGWSDVGVYQRRLATFEQTTVLHGDTFDGGCVNCHAFAAGDPGTMSIATRNASAGRFPGGALVLRNGELKTLATKWGYTSWHPSGRFTAYSLNRVRQFFHSARMETRDVLDLDSELVVYDVETGEAFSDVSIAAPDRMETYPCWSPAGDMLYFASAPIPWQDRTSGIPGNYESVRYDLRRVSFDPTTRTFGDVETVLSAAEAGKSVLMPRVSPDGRYVLCCFCDYGCFPVYQPSSDLVLIDLADGSCRRIDHNSDQSESYHSWSSNGRWIAFSSKRDDGVFTRTYLAYFDTAGRVHKPFVLPQEDPDFYGACLKTFTVPEFTTAPIPIDARAFGRAARSADRTKVVLPETTMGHGEKPGDSHRQEGQEQRVEDGQGET